MNRTAKASHLAPGSENRAQYYGMSEFQLIHSCLSLKGSSLVSTARSAHFKCFYAKNSMKILCQPNSTQINYGIPRGPGTYAIKVLRT